MPLLPQEPSPCCRLSAAAPRLGIDRIWAGEKIQAGDTNRLASPPALIIRAMLRPVFSV